MRALLLASGDSGRQTGLLPVRSVAGDAEVVEVVEVVEVDVDVEDASDDAVAVDVDEEPLTSA